jgi:hypothetical protein
MLTYLFLLSSFVLIRQYIFKKAARMYCYYRLWLPKKNSVLNDEFFKKELVFLDRGVKDSLKHRHQRIKRLSALWYKLPKSDKAKFLKEVKK